MSSNLAPAEAFPFPEPESAAPELRVYEGGGEGGADVPPPELHAVPDPVDSLPGASIVERPADADVDTGIDEEPEAVDVAEVPEDAVEEQDTDRQTAAKRAGRILRSVTTATKEGDLVSGFSDDDQHRRGGGGGWAFREYLRKLAEKEEAAKNHESGCRCEYCLS